MSVRFHLGYWTVFVKEQAVMQFRDRDSALAAIEAFMLGGVGT